MQEVKINNALKCYGLELLKDEKMKDIGRFDRIKVALARLSLRKLDYIIVDDIFKEAPDSEIKYIMSEIKRLIKANDASAIIVSDNIELSKNLKCDKYKLEFGELVKLEENNA
jgi:ABC-type enterochelin transport system ATPase subunit